MLQMCPILIFNYDLIERKCIIRMSPKGTAAKPCIGLGKLVKFVGQ